MKKIILLAAISLSAVSCIVDYGTSSERTPENFIRFSDEIKSSAIDYSIKVLDALLEIDEYVNLTNESDRLLEKYDEVRHHVANVRDDYWNYNYSGTALNINTRGVSINTQNNAWEIACLNVAGWNLLTSAPIHANPYYPGNIEALKFKTKATVTCTDTNKWSIAVESEGGTAIMTMVVSIAPAADVTANTDGCVDYTVESCSGNTQKDSHGYWTKFDSEDVVIASQWSLWDSEIKMQYSGKFNVVTCRGNNVEIDKCIITFGSETTYDVKM